MIATKPTQEKTMKTVYCLYRVSTKGQVDKNDIPMQKQSCREFAEHQPGWVIKKEFQEQGVSGFKVSANDRDAVQELKTAAENKEFDILLVFMFDRIGRIDNETPFVVEWFIKHGIEVWSVNECDGQSVYSAAKVIDSFSSKLRERNKSMSSLWDEIEKNTLGLLENKFAFSDDNKDHLVTYLKSLRGLQDAITQSNESVEGLKTSMNNNLGLERSMNQAIRFAVADLSSYIVITERFKASIDKILAKGKFVVGNID